MPDRLFLHIGTPKSGTTYLQDLIWRNRALLRTQDLLVPGRTLFDHNQASIEVREGRQLRGEAPVWARFEQRFRDVGAAVVSNEWLLAASDEQIAGLVGHLGPERVRVVLTARDLAKVVPAAWQEELKLGTGTSLERFVDQLETHPKWNWDVLDVSRAAQRWARHLPADRIHVVPAPSGPSALTAEAAEQDTLLTRFAGVLGFDPTDLDLSSENRNESLSVQSARVLEEAGPRIAEALDLDSRPWQHRYDWMRNFLSHEVLADFPGDPIGLSPALVEELTARSERLVASLREGGYAISGSAEDLLIGAVRPGLSPADVAASDLVATQSDLAAALVRRLDEATAKLRDTEQTLHALQARTSGRPAVPGGLIGLGDAAAAEQPPTGGLARLGHETRMRAAQAKAQVKRRRQVGDRRRRVTLVVPWAYGMGGIPRTVFAVANELAERDHDVEVLTLVRSMPTPVFDLHPQVTLKWLEDRYDPRRPPTAKAPRPAKDPAKPRWIRELDQQPSVLGPDVHEAFSGYTDALMQRYLETMEPRILVTTRPEFAFAATRWSHPDVVVVHQEHLSFMGRGPGLRKAMAAELGPRPDRRAIDSFCTLTTPDLERWQGQAGPEATADMRVIPNAASFSVGEPSPLDSKVVLAAGRLTDQKGFDMLIEAYAPLAAEFPDWQLHIYGHGVNERALRAQLARHDLGDRIQLRGITHEFERVLSEASIYAMSSRIEGLPMVLLEAFSKGVPPVSFNCPEGPRQLISDGDNGLLIPPADVPALTEGLRKLIVDPALRRRLGAAGMETARSYEIGPITDRWEELFDDLEDRRTGPLRHRRR